MLSTTLSSYNKILLIKLKSQPVYSTSEYSNEKHFFSHENLFEENHSLFQKCFFSLTAEFITIVFNMV